MHLSLVTLRSDAKHRVSKGQAIVARVRVLRFDDASRRSLRSLLSMTAGKHTRKTPVPPRTARSARLEGRALLSTPVTLRSDAKQRVSKGVL